MARRRRGRFPRPVTAQQVDRMAELLSAGYGDERHANVFFDYVYGRELEALKKLEPSKDCLKQATDLYVLASILYEKFPEHTIITDAKFDSLARFLMYNLKYIPRDHLKEYNIRLRDLRAGTGSRVKPNQKIRWMVHMITGEWVEDH